MFLRLTGATAHGGGASAASYLLFSRGFCQELLKLGYRDGMQQAGEIRAFFSRATAPRGDRRLAPANEAALVSEVI
jgi:hypothetical protein